jgi:STE24 endopeptidase
MPLFNTYTKLSDPRLRDPILSMARANGVGANDVYEMDASRQTTRASANVSGLLGTLRITLNDNLLKRSTPAEVQAVMGHELGHYVLNHAYEEVCFFSVLCVVLFAYLRSSLDWALRRWGARWGLRGITDLAVLPLAVLLVASFSFVMTPFVNTFIRMEEHEADIFGLNASREPDGFATTMLKLGEYRKMDPGAFEEWFFYDHPSGRTRITAAMRWKAEHLR